LLMKCPSKYNGSEYQQEELMGEEFVRPV